MNNEGMKKTILLTLLLSSTSLYAQMRRPVALVYGGDGACEEDCVTGAVDAAEKAGFETHIIYPKSYNASVLQDASVWVQPGGYAVQQANSMGPQMMADVKAFVKNGGGYVGYCAGAFLSTEEIGTSGKKGHGFIPGKTKVYTALGYPTVEKMDFASKSKQIYWEGGPFFTMTSEDLKRGELMGNYTRTAQAGFARATYGNGRAYVTGAHPEAPQWWRDSAKLKDSDGLDYDVTTAMMKWAAGIQ